MKVPARVCSEVQGSVRQREGRECQGEVKQSSEGLLSDFRHVFL